MQCWCYGIPSSSSRWWLVRPRLGIRQLKISILFFQSLENKQGELLLGKKKKNRRKKKYHFLPIGKTTKQSRTHINSEKIKTCREPWTVQGAARGGLESGEKNAAVSSQPWLSDRGKSIVFDEIQSSTPSAFVRPHARQTNRSAPDIRAPNRVCRAFQFLLCMLRTIWSLNSWKGGRGGREKKSAEEGEAVQRTGFWLTKQAQASIEKKNQAGDEWGGGDYRPPPNRVFSALSKRREVGRDAAF